MQAVILAAGKGERLRPLTNTLPKAMMSVAGRPLLEHNICLLRDQGFKEFIINLHYLPEKIVDYFDSGEQFGVKIAYSDETDKLLDTAGALKKMEPLLRDDFILIYGDHVHFFDFRPAAAFHRNKRALATIVLKRSDLPANGEIGEIDQKSARIISWHTRPHGITDFGGQYFLNSGLYILSREILNYIPAGRSAHLDKEILPQLIKKDLPIFGFVTKDLILDIGTSDKYQYACREYQKMKSLNK